MNYQQEQSQHGVPYEMSSPGVGGFGFDPQFTGMPGQALGQPGPGWVAVPTPPQGQQHISLPKPQHRVAVAIISLLVLLPITLGLLLSDYQGPFADYTQLVARLIALGIVCVTIIIINLSFNSFRR